MISEVIRMLEQRILEKTTEYENAIEEIGPMQEKADLILQELTAAQIMLNAGKKASKAFSGPTDV